MAKKVIKKKTIKKRGPKKGVAYLSVRAMERAVTKGTKDKSEIAKKLVGYTVKESEGWIVKEYSDTTVERISKIEKTKRPSRLVLD